MNDERKACGACRNPDICQCCGACRNCGKDHTGQREQSDFLKLLREMFPGGGLPTYPTYPVYPEYPTPYWVVQPTTSPGITWTGSTVRTS